MPRPATPLERPVEVAADSLEDRVKLLAVVLSLTLLAGTATPQEKHEGFYESGNEFLRQCDSDSVYMRSQSNASRETFSMVCTFWVLGVIQGMELEDQFRPERPVSKEKEKAEQAKADMLKRYGFTGVSIPSGDACLPADATNEQYKLVVLAYMKTHPGELTQPASTLTIAAIKTQWICSDADSAR